MNWDGKVFDMTITDAVHVLDSMKIKRLRDKCDDNPARKVVVDSERQALQVAICVLKMLDNGRLVLKDEHTD